MSFPHSSSDLDPFSLLAVAGISQHARLLRLQTPRAMQGVNPELVVERFIGLEAINKLFQFDIDVLATSSAFDPAALLGEELTLRLLLPDGGSRAWHGRLASAQCFGGDGGLARFRLHLQPWLTALGLRRDSFVYANKNVREIIDEVFSDHVRAHWRFELTRELAVRPTCVQYRESDLAFVRRLLAQEGLSFRFEHEQGEEDQAASSALASQPVAPSNHCMVIFDRHTPLRECTPSQVPFHRIDATESRDAITHWEARRQVRTNSATVSAWNASVLNAPLGQTRSHLDQGEVPALEHFDGAGAQRYANMADARNVSERLVAAHESLSKRFQGQGSARQLAPARRFTLIDHPRHGDEGFTVLAVTHEAANNLGAEVAEVVNRLDREVSGLGIDAGSEKTSLDLEKGSYRNRFVVQREEAPIVPRWIPSPTAPESMIVRVVGVDDEQNSGIPNVHTQRDHRALIRFYWQPDPVEVQANSQAYDESLIPAPGAPRVTLVAAGRRKSSSPSVWVRVATSVAGPNWGEGNVPRTGTDALVHFIEGDIDRFVLSGQLHNAQDLPPWSAGCDSEANHPGVLSGWHSKGLDGKGFNQWLVDDAPGQVRTRLASSHAASQLNLGHLNAQAPTSANRGAWRGTGAELRTDAWAMVRAGQGLLVSSVAQPRAAGTVMDTTSARSQLNAARQAAQRLGDAAEQGQGLKLTANERLQPLADDLDPKKNGHWHGPVNGQSSQIPKAGTREDSDAPVPAFARPLMVFDAVNSMSWTTPASSALWANDAIHWTSHAATHWAAAKTVSLAAGASSGLFVFEGGIRAIAQDAAVSLQAHTDLLAWAAKQDLTITSSHEGIEILAKERIEFKGGQTSIVLDGRDITLTMPVALDVKGTAKTFVGPAGAAAVLPTLPFLLPDPPPEALSVPETTEVRTITLESPLDDGSANDGSGTATQKAMVYGKPYTFAVTTYTKGEPNNPASIKWKLKYDSPADSKNATIEKLLSVTGERVQITIDDKDMCGCNITVSAYILDENGGGSLTRFVHNRYRRFDSQLVAKQIAVRQSTPWRIDQGMTSLCGMAALYYAMVKQNPAEYEKLAKVLLRTGEYDTQRDYTVRPNSSAAEKMYATQPNDAAFQKMRMPEVDWLVLATSRSGESDFGYDGTENGPIDQLTAVNWPGILENMLKPVAGFSEVDSTGLTLITLPIKKSPLGELHDWLSDSDLEDLLEIDAKYQQGYQVLLMIDFELIGGPESYNPTHLFTDSHWIVYEGNLRLEDAAGNPTTNASMISRIYFDAYTWGTDPKTAEGFPAPQNQQQVNLPVENFRIFGVSKISWESNYYGYILAK